MVIEFNVVFGEEVKKVNITLDRFGSGRYTVLIDNYYCGAIFKRDGEWTGHVNELSELTMDDIQAMGEIIDERENSGH